MEESPQALRSKAQYPPTQLGRAFSADYQMPAHIAILCPLFHRAEIVENPNAWDRLIARLRARVIGWLQPAELDLRESLLAAAGI